MKKVPVFLILILTQFAVLALMIHSKERILQNGEMFRFKTRPIDPADPFQGRYVRLMFEDDYIPLSQGQVTELKYKEPIYAKVETNEEGFARFSGWCRDRPSSGSFLKTRYLGPCNVWNPTTRKSSNQGLRIDIPFNRYYMDEAKAPRAEQAVRDATRSTNCWVNVRILEGQAVVEDVFAKGQSLRDLSAKKDKTK